MSTDNWLNTLDEEAKKESGGGGIIAAVDVRTGYKVFVSGLGNRDSFFPCNFGNEPEAKAAEAKGKATGGDPKKAVEIIVYKATVKGKEVTWKDDRFFTTPLWTDGFKKVVRPSLNLLSKGMGRYWAKIGFKADPSGRTKVNQNGETGPELIAFIAEVYTDEAAATSAAGPSSNGTGEGFGETVSDPNVPAGYGDMATWQGMKGDIVKAIATQTAVHIKAKAKPSEAKALALAEVAATYEATVEQVQALVK